MKYFFLFLVLALSEFGICQTTSPFSFGSYVAYDFDLDVSGYNVGYQNFNYRDNMQEYYESPSVRIFCFANNRTTKKLHKPFVFVEGISFDKPFADAGRYYFDEYFYQLGNRVNDISIHNQALLDLMVTTQNPGGNPFVGYSTFNWATLVSGIDAEGVANNDPLRVEKTPELLNKLYCAGYDIVFVDFANGEHFIENNGEALFNGLAEIKQLMLDNGSTEKMAVCGASMGGLVARYAMRKHELAGHTDWFSHFISFDSPQQGANINLGLQYTLKHLSAFPLFPDMVKESYAKVTCPSASQLVRYSCLSTSIQPPILYTTPSMSLERWELLLNPNMLTWPTSCKLVSITNGSRYGTVQNPSPYTNGCQTLDGEGAIEIQLYSLPNTTAAPQLITSVNVLNNCPFLSTSLWGSLSKKVYVSNCLPLDNMAGSYRNDVKELVNSMPQWLSATGVFPMPVCNLLDADDYFQDFGLESNTCFIPLLSSAGIIDFDNNVSLAQAVTNSLFQGREKFEDPQHNVSHFDVVYAPVDNQTHVEITDENIEWVMTELIAKKDIAFQNEVIPNGTYQARETIKAGRDVDKYGDNCMQPFQAEMSPQYSNTAGLIQTCGPVSPQSGSVVVLHAGSRIELHPGFTTGNVAYFEASLMGALGCGAQSGIRYAAEGYEPNQDSQQLLAGLQTMAATETKPMLAGREGVLFVLQPNPTRGEVLLKSNLNEEKWIEVRDVQGRLLQKLNSTQSEIPLNLSDLPAGLYYISSTGEQHRFVSKVLKE